MMSYFRFERGLNWCRPCIEGSIVIAKGGVMRPLIRLNVVQANLRLTLGTCGFWGGARGRDVFHRATTAFERGPGIARAGKVYRRDGRLRFGCSGGC